MCLILILMRSATKFKTHTHSYSLWSDARSYSHFAHTHVQLALHIHTTNVFLAPKTGAKFEIFDTCSYSCSLTNVWVLLLILTLMSTKFWLTTSYSLTWAAQFAWLAHTHSREHQNVLGLLILIAHEEWHELSWAWVLMSYSWVVPTSALSYKRFFQLLTFSLYLKVIENIVL